MVGHKNMFPSLLLLLGEQILLERSFHEFCGVFTISRNISRHLIRENKIPLCQHDLGKLFTIFFLEFEIPVFVKSTPEIFLENFFLKISGHSKNKWPFCRPVY